MKILTGTEVIHKNLLPWKVNPRKLRQYKAMGYYSFCRECNNFLGTKYVNSFKEFSDQLPFLNKDIDVPASSNYVVEFKLDEIKPLNIIKHIYSMFIALNSIGWSKSHQDIRQFVLQPEANSIPKYLLGFYIRRGSFRGDIHIPFTVTCKISEKNKLRMIAFSQIDTIKAGYYLQELSLDIDYGINLSDYFSNLEIDEVASFNCNAIAFERNHIFPMDFRGIKDFELL